MRNVIEGPAMKVIKYISNEDGFDTSTPMTPNHPSLFSAINYTSKMDMSY